MANTALAKINREVKRQKKLHPSMSHKAAQKKAGSMYKAGKLGRVKKKKAPKKAKSKKKVIHRSRSRSRLGSTNKSHRDGIDRKKVDITIGSVEAHRSMLRRLISKRVGELEAKKMAAKTVKAKRPLIQKINKLKATYRKLD
jgi:hypothetical protein